MSGGFLFVVGPSGAGKDTLIGLAKAQLAGDERFVFPRRVITRAKSAAEDHDTIDQEGFERAVTAGRFCLSWRAHGLCYGIPRAAAEQARAGRFAVCNVSRTVIADARRRFAGVFVVEVTASPDVLAGRLTRRAREEDGSFEERLRRSDAVPNFQADIVIENNTAAEPAAAQLLALMRDLANPRASGAAKPERCAEQEAAVR